MSIGTDCHYKMQLDLFNFLIASNQTLDSDKCRSGTAVDTRSDTYAKTSFLLRANDCADQVDNFLFIMQQFLPGDVADFKIFQTSPFWLLDSASLLRRLLK
jgi:hypothetical protein